MWGVARVDDRIALAPGVLLLTGDERRDAMSGCSVQDTRDWIKSVHRPGSIVAESGQLVRPDLSCDGADASLQILRYLMALQHAMACGLRAAFLPCLWGDDTELIPVAEWGAKWGFLQY